MKTHHRLSQGGPTALPRLFLLALCFFCGVVLGQVLAGRVPDATGDELKRYLSGYLALEGGNSAETGLSCLILYFRYPLLAFLLGFASIGAVLLPCTAVVFGTFLSFSVCCFTAAFGRDGVLLALAVFGLRCAVTLPVFFLLASSAWGRSMSLAAISLGRGRAPVVYGRDWWMTVFVCCGVLLVAVGADLAISPPLLRLALGRLFP